MIRVYMQYFYALAKVESSFTKGYLGYYFYGGLYPKVEEMIKKKGFSVLHPPLSGGTVVRIKE